MEPEIQEGIKYFPNPKTQWIETFTGKRVCPLAFKVGDFCVEDVAHALALTCRFNGHCKEFYSVAQHSVLVSQLVDPEFALKALLHDAGEAYIGDLVSPIKKGVLFGKEPIQLVEDNILFSIFEQLGLSGVYPNKPIKAADTTALRYEQQHLMPGTWTGLDARADALPPLECEPCMMAKWTFLSRYEALIGEVK